MLILMAWPRCVTLFNLDRPYNADELNAAHEALAKSVLLENQQPDGAESYILQGANLCGAQRP
jgi:hypothetical protein